MIQKSNGVKNVTRQNGKKKNCHRTAVLLLVSILGFFFCTLSLIDLIRKQKTILWAIYMEIDNDGHSLPIPSIGQPKLPSSSLDL